MTTSPTRLPSLRRPAGKSRPLSMIEGPLTNIPNLSNESSEIEPSKKTNRRSLLAQLSRKAPIINKDQVGTKEEGDEHDSGSSRPSEDTRTSNESTGRRALDGETQNMLPPSKLSRPVSMIPPRGSSSKTSKTRSHVSVDARETDANADTSRSETLAALQGAVPAPAFKLAATESGLQKSGSTKLPQAPRAGGPAIPSRTTSARVKSSQSPKSKSTNGIQAGAVITITEERTSPTKSRTPSVYASNANQTSNEPSTLSSQHSSTRSTSQAPQKTSPPRPSVTSRSRPASQIVPPVSKPAFNTYQQHYSPAKSSLPKPPVPAAKHASKPSTMTEEDVPVSFEVIKQQIELLQLSILHQSSAKCMNDYNASAKRKLGKMHTKLRKEYENLRATELVHQRAVNLAALDTWCSDTGLLVENMQILSLVYSDLTSLMEAGSRHSDIVSMFELWMSEVETPEPGAFIQPLSDDWKASQASLVLKLRSIQRNLRVLPPVQQGGETSGVEVVFKACKSLVEDMLKELEVMAKLEKEVMAREEMRVNEDVNSLVTNDAGMREEPWLPPWQKAP